MNGNPICVLLVEDNPGDANLVQELLLTGRGSYQITHCQRLATALEHLREKECDIILLDLSLPDSRGLSTFEAISERVAEIPIVILTGFNDEVLADQAIQHGAKDFLPKRALDHTLLERSIRYAMDRTGWERSIRQNGEHVRRLERLESLGRLSAGIAHNFNNLLTVIIGNCELIINQPGMDAGIHRRIKVIQDAARRAGGFTRSVMAFGRKLPMRRCGFSLNMLIHELQPLLQGGISKDVRFRFDLHAQSGHIHADPALFEQVVLNLVLNAHDAMPSGGEIAIRTMPVDLAADAEGIPDSVPPGRYAALMVSDSGRGIEAANLNHIFEPFFSTKEESAGRGLGLATVYGIISQNQGFIQVVSQPGAGTTFTIYLPRLDPANIPHARTGQGSLGEQSQGLETILLVEAAPEISEFLAEALRDIGHKVLTANDGKSGLAVFLQHADTISTVVWDAEVPRVGPEAGIAKVRALFPEMPIILLVGQEGGRVEDAEVLKPAVRLLAKPFSPRMLACTIREEIDRVSHRQL